MPCAVSAALQRGVATGLLELISAAIVGNGLVGELRDDVVAVISRGQSHAADWQTVNGEGELGQLGSEETMSHCDWTNSAMRVPGKAVEKELVPDLERDGVW